MSIDITGINKAQLLAGLYNRQAPLPGTVAFLSDLRRPMTEQVATVVLNLGEEPKGEWHFDYVHGRPIKLSFVGDTIEGEHLFDRNAGEGACARVVAAIRRGGA